ncbi:MAG TPA: DUF2336 domain-containing protein [Alphaproteobacteria bacterium]|nr:DUF2336 domain-containing protein [Alphaproteobacteria bacterium]
MTRESIAAMRRRLENAALPLDYDETKKFLVVDDTNVRKLLASRRDVPQEVLYYLAQDAMPEVRVAVAANPETPIQAELLLSRDASEDVRFALAGKVAQVAGERSADGRPGRTKLFFELLKALARDELARIRRIVSQAVKDIANIPRDIVRSLASDADPEVAAPVLKDSPVLREHDLISAMQANPAAAVIGAVAQRADLGAALSDAVVATGSESGIAALLANDSAQIREETLDLLIERAAEIPSWQESLVERPKLSARAVTRLAHVVAGTLAEKLARREDLDSGLLEEIERVASVRLSGPDAVGPRPSPGQSVAPAAGGPESQRPPSVEGAKPKLEDDAGSVATAIGRARSLLLAGALNEDAVAGAVAQRDRPFVAASLALKTKLPFAVVDKIIAISSAKGITALVWKAGFTMRLSVQLQTRLAGILPNKAIYARDGVGFPLTEDEMRWQLEFFDAA